MLDCKFVSDFLQIGLFQVPVPPGNSLALSHSNLSTLTTTTDLVQRSQDDSMVKKFVIPTTLGPRPGARSDILRNRTPCEARLSSVKGHNRFAPSQAPQSAMCTDFFHHNVMNLMDIGFKYSLFNFVGFKVINSVVFGLSIELNPTARHLLINHLRSVYRVIKMTRKFKLLERKRAWWLPPRSV